MTEAKKKGKIRKEILKMKKIMCLVIVAVVLCAALVGCGEAGGVSTDGSTSMSKVIGALSEDYENETGVAVTYNATGSGSGIQAVVEGRCDIGLSSRNLKDEEKAKGLTATVLAYDGIAIIVNPENPVADLDVKTIAKIYTGEITNWKEVGGKDAEIVLIGREAGSGTRDGFEAITDTEDKCTVACCFASSAGHGVLYDCVLNACLAKGCAERGVVSDCDAFVLNDNACLSSLDLIGKLGDSLLLLS